MWPPSLLKDNVSMPSPYTVVITLQQHDARTTSVLQPRSNLGSEQGIALEHEAIDPVFWLARFQDYNVDVRRLLTARIRRGLDRGKAVGTIVARLQPCS
jgi:hypothetical protein